MFKKYGKWMLGILAVQIAVGAGLYLEPCHDSGIFFGTCEGWRNVAMLYLVLPIYVMSDVVLMVFGWLGVKRQWGIIDWLIRSLTLIVVLIGVFLVLGYKWITR